MTANQIAFYPQSSGGGSGAYTLISSQTLVAPAASISFTGIPQTFTTLKMFINSPGCATASGRIQLNFNGDVTAAHYFLNQITAAFNSTATPVGGFSTAGALVGSINATAGGGSEVSIFQYTSAGQKFFTGMGVGAIGYWSNGIYTGTSPVTNIVATLESGSGNWLTGTTISLYGLQ